MSAKGVLVTSQDKSGKILSLSSAVFFDDVVLLHGNHLTPLLEEEKWMNVFNSVLPSPILNTQACILLEEVLEFWVSEESDDGNILPLTVEREGRRFVTAGMWRCPLVRESLQMLRTVENDSILSCLSIFLILKIPGVAFSFADRIPFWIGSLEMPIRGGSIIVESTPADMLVFINSWSHGVVARLCGSRSCMFLTDAAVHSECTGAPVYNAVCSSLDTIEKGSLLGVVLRRNDNFTYGIALLPVLSRIAPTVALPPRLAPPQSSLQRLVDETVCAISSGDLWGSGVVVDARRGIVITCSHVIQNDATTVKMYMKNDIFTCDVIYRIGTCDLAVLKASSKSSLNKHMEIAESPPRLGAIVCLAGFPHVPPFQEKDFRPFISFGCISKTLPYAIICNCNVTKGYSGGAIIRDQKLLGLVSFIETGQSGFGFIVPAAVFRESIRKYIEFDTVTHLKSLESADEQLGQFWNLNCSKL